MHLIIIVIAATRNGSSIGPEVLREENLRRKTALP